MKSFVERSLVMVLRLMRAHPRASSAATTGLMAAAMVLLYCDHYGLGGALLTVWCLVDRMDAMTDGMAMGLRMAMGKSVVDIESMIEEAVEHGWSSREDAERRSQP